MKKLKIVKLPDERLRKKSKNLKSEDISRMKEYIDALIAAMFEYDGIGIASVQVGHMIRLVIISTDSGPLCLVNPEIVKHSHETDTEEEGCLSVPKLFAPVKRSKKIKVEALDINGKKIKFEASGLFARVIQHEVDHINGILFVDKAEKEPKGHIV
ncbi:MAG TPA: peptide deformylase [Patescibacteria group bacterium]|nr:peptide deformylase [Patescibacteria group bacterium]